MSKDVAPELSRRDVLLGMIQKEYPQYHPLVSIARIAHDQNADLKVQLECHKTIAKYVEPELKSIEVRGEINGRHKVSVSLFEAPDASFSHVIEGEVVNDGVIENKSSSARQLPGGATIDVDNSVVDRVVGNW